MRIKMYILNLILLIACIFNLCFVVHDKNYSAIMGWGMALIILVRSSFIIVF